MSIPLTACEATPGGEHTFGSQRLRNALMQTAIDDPLILDRAVNAARKMYPQAKVVVRRGRVFAIKRGL